MSKATSFDVNIRATSKTFLSYNYAQLPEVLNAILKLKCFFASEYWFINLDDKALVVWRLTTPFRLKRFTSTFIFLKNRHLSYLMVIINKMNQNFYQLFWHKDPVVNTNTKHSVIQKQWNTKKVLKVLQFKKELKWP